MDFSSLFLVLKQGHTSGPYATAAVAQKARAVTVNYGTFVNTVISFVIVAFAVFLLVRAINRIHHEQEGPAKPSVRDCPFCPSKIAIKATRCPQCTSNVEAV